MVNFLLYTLKEKLVSGCDQSGLGLNFEERMRTWKGSYLGLDNGPEDLVSD